MKKARISFFVLLASSVLFSTSGYGDNGGGGGSSPTDTLTTAISTISISGAHLTAMAVYETGNKIFAADDDHRSLAVIDGATNQVVAEIPNVGGGIFQMAVNETYGKVYVASDVACCTTGITPGTGLISIIDAKTNQIVEQIHPGQQINNSDFLLVGDEVHDKVYAAFYSGVGVIDAATDAFTPIPGTDAPFQFIDKIGINTVTNEIFIPSIRNNRINIINGNTLDVGFFDLTPTGAHQPLDIAVNEMENKLYLTMIVVPGQSNMGIFILDRDTGAYKFVGADDLEPLAFNNASNTLFTGVQVGTNASIVDGATDSLTYVNLGTAGIGAIAVRNMTDHAYLANQQYTVIMDGSTKTSQRLPTNITPSGGLITQRVAINQSAGRVYVINDGKTGTITAYQD